MSAGRIANRYAKALYNQAKDLDEAQQFAESLSAVRELFQLDESKQILNSPIMPVDLKQNLLQYGLSRSQRHEALVKFLDIVIEAGRVSLVPKVEECYGALLEEAKGIRKAEITTAVPIGKKIAEKISSSLSEQLGKEIVLDRKVDESIVGGLVIKIGNSLIDFSLRTKLAGLAEKAAL